MESTDKIKGIVSIFVYILINSLFIIKYTSRLNNYNAYIFLFLYILSILFFLYFFSKISVKESYYKIFFLVIGIIFLFFTIYVNMNVDGITLNVDRWSAMDVGINALLNGEYPYSAIDHLGGRTSNLPTLLFIGLPFFLMGDVGYLQSFSFILFAFILYKVFKSNRTRVFALILLIISPSYLWEIYVKSDLMSNFIIVLFVLTFLKRKMTNIKSILILSFISTSIVLTRLTAIIPISLWLFKMFYNLTIKNKMLFIFTSVLTTSILLYICFHNVNSIEHFKLHNPFVLQNRQLPLVVSVFTLILPIIYSFKISNFKTLVDASSIFLFLPIIISFFINTNTNGIYKSVFDSAFDISYFNILTPFLLLSITFNFKELLPTKNIVHLADRADYDGDINK